ncbi:hypothetical protein CEP54_005291 [Fusarium duplospermum]|uniref:DUF3533 domain-containing protein n=1 Tax=Fusarium duplospermum TaxID=1325734 RepID=A0A428QDB3_9HYPO|nr:hypothetical protein CEP54_005291 [Fusarium duplospermum]
MASVLSPTPGVNSERVGLGEWRPRWQATVLPTAQTAIQLMVMLLGVMSYLFGTSHNQADRYHARKMLIVDLDGGEVGKAVTQAAINLGSSKFRSIEIGQEAQFDSPAEVKEAVCHADYWAAVTVPANSSASLARALQESSNSSPIYYTYNQARYPTIADSVLVNSIRQIHEASRDTIQNTLLINNTFENAPQPLQATFLHPLALLPDLILPTAQPSRVFYNTVNVVRPTLVQFFLCLGMNVSGQMSGFFREVKVRDVYLFRFTVGELYCAFLSIIVTGYIWAFRSDWTVDSAVYGKSFGIYLLYLDVQWQLLESSTGTFVPMMYMPYFLVTWIIMNVSSSVYPFEVMAGFYRIGWAMPSRHLNSLLIYAWSGCANPLKEALPVLFAWWLVLHGTAALSVKKRCCDARGPVAMIEADREVNTSSPSSEKED